MNKIKQISTDVFAGIVGAIVLLILIISHASIIFIGPFKPYLQEGISILLISVIVVNFILPFYSKLRWVVGATAETTVIIIALSATSIAAEFQANVSHHNLFLTLAMLIVLSGFIVGVFLYLLGLFQLGNIIRFIPFPVMVAFLAGTGYLIIYFSSIVIIGTPPSADIINQLLTFPYLVQWVPTLLFALVFLFISFYFKNIWIFPVVIGVALILFFLLLKIFHITIENANFHHLFLGPFLPHATYYNVYTEVTHVDGYALLLQAGNVFALCVLTPIGLLLKTAAIEIEMSQATNFNRELKASGLGNIIASLVGGGFVSYIGVSSTLLNASLHARSKLAAMTASFVCLLILFFGISYIGYLPKFIFAGILLAMGMQLFANQILKAHQQFSAIEKVVVSVILITIILLGLLTGILLGILISMLIFIFKYSHINIFKHELTRELIQSNFERDKNSQIILNTRGREIRILQLQGYLFFGNADKILKKIITYTKQEPFKFIILDFSEVSGMDSSSLYSFRRLNHLLAAKKITLVFVHLKKKIQTLLADLFLFDANKNNCYHFETLDYGLEWCEDQIILDMPEDSLRYNFYHLLNEVISEADQVKKILSYFELITIPPGIPLFSQNERSDAMYFLQEGLVEVFFTDVTGHQTRLRKMGPGTFVGEMGLYLNASRSATIIPTLPCILYKLTQQSLQKIEQEEPELASLLHRLIISELALRLSYANNQIDHLLKPT
jgi:SulP family sulfate permease